MRTRNIPYVNEDIWSLLAEADRLEDVHRALQCDADQAKAASQEARRRALQRFLCICHGSQALVGTKLGVTGAYVRMIFDRTHKVTDSLWEALKSCVAGDQGYIDG